jgi:1-aminocyclopropane-1-carboxylate deaminase/D-cysteine desulfhydrase-like pyridoxal-dependent ACC family enzyme
LESAKVELWIQREDQLHPRLAGNKWRKLKYNIQAAIDCRKSTLVSFGGAYSNHIAALAEAGNIFGLDTIGIIRGEEDPLNPTLKKASSLGMKLIYVSRSVYRDKQRLIKELQLDRPEAMIIPEGGSNENALTGTAEIIQSSPMRNKADYWCVACGTGGTAAGMINTLDENEHLIGFPVLKGIWMEQVIENWLAQRSGSVNNKNWSLCTDYHFGGYARYDQHLINFINRFQKEHNIQLDPIYTGKMFYGLFDLIKKAYFKPRTCIVAIHTGGLQGLAGFRQRHGELLDED